MHDGLCHPEEHKPDAHPGRKQHGKPGVVTEIGLGMIGAKFDVTVTGQPEKSDAEQDQCHCQNVKPAGICENLLLQ